MMLSDLAQAKKLFPWGLFKRSPLCYIAFKSQFSSVKSELGANIAVKNMKDKPLVSILINNYNYGRFLKDAIESTLNQSYQNIEVIIVDDGSTDESREILEGYAANNTIKVILKSNGGQASAFNVGFAASQGDIICFLDADDIFIPEKVEIIIKEFQKHPEVSWYFHLLKFLRKSNEHQSSSYSRKYSEVHDLRSCMENGKLNGSLPFEIQTATSGMCFQRSLIQKILPMPEIIRITSDDYIKYAALGTSRGVISFQPLALQRIHDNNAYTSCSNISHLKAKTQILTAYSLRENFPTLTNFSNNLVSMGIYICWQLESVESDLNGLINTYIEASSPLEKLAIYTKAGYYRFLKYNLDKISSKQKDFFSNYKSE